MDSRLLKGFRPKGQSGHVSLIARDKSSNEDGELPELGVSIPDWGSHVSDGDGNPLKLSTVIGVKIMLCVVDVVLDISRPIKALYS